LYADRKKVNHLPRAKNAKAEVALNLYRQGVLLKDIAAQLNVPAGTVRRWKSTYKWEDSERSQKESERSQNKKSILKDDIESVNENVNLTEKQRLFCLYYVRCFSATKAYQKAYQCDYFTAKAHGFELLRVVAIKTEIQRLKQSRLNRELLDESDIFQKYMDIAFADVTDFVEFGQDEEYVIGPYGVVEIKDPETGEKKPLTQKINTVRFKESKDVDGTLISEIKNGRNGASIKLADRMRALDWLADHMDLATDEQKARIAALKMKSAPDEPEETDTSYVDALKALVDKAWDNAEEESGTV
jgi:phage terminase small subunit